MSGPASRLGGLAAGVALAWALLAVGGSASAGAAACDPAIVEVETAGGVAAYAVEIADTPEARARGLMFRRDLPRDAGMLFVYPVAEDVAFWMKNTPLPLDMLFIGADGRVCGIVARAEPFSLDPRPSGCPARAVLEVHGGEAARRGIGLGARVRHPALGPDAAWPCGD